jgi:asparagine synthase (glutamine-hydrolysing)
VTPDAVAFLPRLVWHYNEPFADSSAVPTFAVTRLAREHVTVALTGDGSDESFLGYDRYVATEIASRLSCLPAGIPKALKRASALLPAGAPRSRLHRLRRFAEALDLPPRRQYWRWLACFDDQSQQTCTPSSPRCWNQLSESSRTGL